MPGQESIPDMYEKFSDIRAIERQISGLQKIMKIRQFATMEEAQKYVLSFKGAPVPELGGPRSSAESAQEIIYQAYEKSDPKERVRMAYSALRVYPDCADAYNLLAEDEALDDAAALKSYLKAEDAGRSAVGAGFIRDNRGYLWDFIEARPYMRAMEGVANELWCTGKKNEAIKKCREMLKLNERDNQGIRYTLMRFLVEAQKFRNLAAFMDTDIFEGDNDIQWFYTKPMALFAASGDSPGARTAVEKAINRNFHVVKYMDGHSKIPETLPDKFTPGSEEEAVIYAANNLALWMLIPGAFGWLNDTARGVIIRMPSESVRAEAGEAQNGFSWARKIWKKKAGGELPE